MNDPDRDENAPPADLHVRDNPDAHRYELDVEGEVAFLQYDWRGDRLVLLHIEVPKALRGRGLANSLAKFALDKARAEGLQPLIVCPFIKAFIQRHPEYAAPLPAPRDFH